MNMARDFVGMPRAWKVQAAVAAAALLVAASVGLWGFYRAMAFLSYKAIEVHVERKVEQMVRPEALR